MQSRTGSVVETSVNIITGFIISMGINAWILPTLGYHVTASENLIIVSVFTVVSIVRSYIFRRMFNYLTMRFKF